MDAIRSRTGLVATLLGVVGFVSVAALAIFFAVGGPFGSINDWTIGLSGVLTGALAVALSDRTGGSDRIRWTPVLVLALVGAAVVVVGAALVISDATGFMLAGLVESLGFAMVGMWLILTARSMAGEGTVPRSLARAGIVAGAVMAIGFAVVPGVVTGLDDLDAAPAWVWIGFVGWFGIFFLYPAWCLLLGATLRRPASAPSAAEVS